MPSDALFVTKPFSFNFRPIFIWHISQRVQKSTFGDACSISWKKIILKVVSTDYQTKNQKIVQAQLTRKENCIMTLFVFLCELIRAFLARMCCWLTRYVFFSLSNSKRYTSRLYSTRFQPNECPPNPTVFATLLNPSPKSLTFRGCPG